MNRKIFFVLLFHLICVLYVSAQLRAFNDIFPNLSRDELDEVFNETGFIKSDSKSKGFKTININKLAVQIDPEILQSIQDMEPGYLVESISVISGNPDDFKFLNIYNALLNIRDLKGRLYSSYTRKQFVPLFEDATRVLSEKNTSSIPDPPPSKTVPREETVFIKLKDVNFGNSYYRANLKMAQNGLCYSLTNFKSLSYLFVPVIKEGNFTAMLYFEPIKEGLLIYGFAGVNISDFFASKISVNSAISKRLGVIISWAADGIQNQ